MIERNGYGFSRQWHDFAFENPDKATTTHAAIIFWLIELNNRLGWKQKFGVPTVNSMEATNIKSYKTFKKCFDELIEWGFVKLHQKATNNHTSNIIELVIFPESNTNSLSNSITILTPTQLPNEYQINDKLSVDIDKQINNKPKNQKHLGFDIFWELYHSITGLKKTNHQAALKYWEKLAKTEREKATEKIKLFYENQNPGFCPIARTYLSDKRFDDEFKTGQSHIMKPAAKVQEIDMEEIIKANKAKTKTA